MEGENNIPKKTTRSKKNTYQSKYWDDYFTFVSKCLARDGFSNSKSNTETTVRDTFYLERKDTKDFLTWFNNDYEFENAKQKIIELLTNAKRKSSNLDNDIKYYIRDISYFREFLEDTQRKKTANSLIKREKHI